MIESLRKWGSSWPAKILLGLLAISMGAFWGMGDLFTGLPGFDTVAQVGETKISSRDLVREMETRLALIEQKIGRGLTPDEIKKARLPVSILMEIIQQTLLDEEANRLNLTISDAAVKRAVLKNPAFQDEAGKFSRSRFEHFLRVNRHQERQFLDKLKKEMRRQQLINTLSATIQMPNLMTQLLLNGQFQKRHGRVLTLDSAQTSIPKPPRESLQLFYNREKERFRLKETRDVTLAILDIEQLANDIEVTEADLRAAFDKRALTFEEKGQTFDDVRADLQQECRSQKATTRLYEIEQQMEDDFASGLSLESVASKYKLSLITLKSISQRLNPEDNTTLALLPEDPALRQDILNEVFQAKQGGDPILKRVKNAQHYVFCVNAVKPSSIPPFAEIVKAVEASWTKEQQQKAAFKAALAQAKALRSKAQTPQGFTPLPPVSLSDTDELPEVPPQVKTLLFEMAPGDFRVTQNPQGKVFIVQLLRIEDASAENTQGHTASLSDRLRSMLVEDFLEAYIQSLRPRFRVDIKRPVLENFLR